MNKIIGFIIISIVYLSCKQDRKAEVSLSSYVYDFGMISPDSIYCDSITLTNVGNAKLDIGEIETGCGCTHASIDKYEKKDFYFYASLLAGGLSGAVAGALVSIYCGASSSQLSAIQDEYARSGSTNGITLTETYMWSSTTGVGSTSYRSNIN